MKLETNADQVALRMKAASSAVTDELRRAGPQLAERLAAEMRRRAPKGVRSTLANSVRVQRMGPYEFLVKPDVAYAVNVEKGRKPGKGLPRFFDPAAASAVAWLQGMLGAAARAANPKYRRGRLGSRRRTAEEQDLRDRYFMWSRSVKARGIKAQPFVKPTADALRAEVQAGLVAAVQAGLARMKGTP